MSGKTQVSYNGIFGISTVYKNLKMLSADDFRRVASERGISILDKGNNTDFQKEIEQTGLQQNHHIAFYGGSNESSYRVSLGFMDRQGVILNEDMKNFTSNMNMTQRMFDGFLNCELGMFGSIQKNHNLVDLQKTFYSAATFNPTYPNHKDPDSGSWDGITTASQITNPLAWMEVQDHDATSHISTHARLTFNLMDELKLVLFGAYTYNIIENSQYLPTSVWAHGQAYKGTKKMESLLGNMMLTYKKGWKKHYFDALALAELQKETYTGFYTTVTNFNTDKFGYHNLQAGALRPWEGTNSYYEQPHLASFMGRFNYTYADRYSLTMTARTDASSKFGANHKWGFFPSVAGGWLVTNEKFMENALSVLSKLKFRGSYGLVGNDQLAGRRFAFLSTINSGNGFTYGLTGNQGIGGKFEGDFGVEDLSWETVKKTDIGVEIGLWDCVNIQADYFHEKREDIFMQRKTIPETAGFNTNPWANFGIVKNQGFDASLEVNKSFGKDFFLSLRGNFTFSRNEIVEYDESETMKQTTRARTGNPLNTYYGLKAIGLFQEEDFKADGTLVNGIPDHTFEPVKPGDIRYEDTNHDGKVDAYDYQPIGRPSVPEIVYGFGFSARWKSFDLSAFFQGSTNVSNMIQGDLLIPGSGGGGLGNIYANCDDRWDPSDPYRQVFWPRLSTNKSSNNMQYSTWWLKDVSYLRLKNLEVGYTFPKKWQKAAMMRDARIFFRGSNLLTWAAFDMWDPEINSSDGMKYPLMKVYSFGFQVTF